MGQNVGSCRNCGSPLQEADLFCGQCGHPVTVDKEEPFRVEPVASGAPGKRRWPLFAVIALVLVSAAGAVYLFRGKFLHRAPVPLSQQQETLNRPKPIPLKPAIPQLPLPQAGSENVRERAYYENAASEAFQKRNCGFLKEVLDTGLKAYPDSAKLCEWLAGYHMVCRLDIPKAARGQRALRAALKAYNLDASDGNAVNVGWIYQSMLGDCYSAVAYYEKGMRHARIDPSLYYHTGRCYETLRNTSKAVEYYESFLRSAPNHKYADAARSRLVVLGR